MRFGIFLFVAFVLLAGLWSLLRPLPQATPMPGAATPTASAEVTPATRRLHIDVPPAAGAQAIAVLQAQVGDPIELSVLSTQDDELHLHGYDLSLPLRGGEAGTLKFTAEHAGRFEIELHNAHAQIGVLEIAPR